MNGKRKLVILLIIALMLFLSWGFDSIRAKEFTIEVVSMSSEYGIADGQTPITIELRVTYNGEPCEDHILYGLSLTGGSFRAKRVKTDENGIATFTYYPYYKSVLNDLVDVTLHFEDESNSILVVVPAELDIVIPMVEPDEDNSDNQTNEGMFG